MRSLPRICYVMSLFCAGFGVVEAASGTGDGKVAAFMLAMFAIFLFGVAEHQMEQR